MPFDLHISASMASVCALLAQEHGEKLSSTLVDSWTKQKAACSPIEKLCLSTYFSVNKSRHYSLLQYWVCGCLVRCHQIHLSSPLLTGLADNLISELFTGAIHDLHLTKFNTLMRSFHELGFFDGRRITVDISLFFFNEVLPSNWTLDEPLTDYTTNISSEETRIPHHIWMYGSDS